MADRAALEMPCALTGTAGSNPALSVTGDENTHGAQRRYAEFDAEGAAQRIPPSPFNSTGWEDGAIRSVGPPNAQAGIHMPLGMHPRILCDMAELVSAGD